MNLIDKLKSDKLYFIIIILGNKFFPAFITIKSSKRYMYVKYVDDMLYFESLSRRHIYHFDHDLKIIYCKEYKNLINYESNRK